MAESPLDYLKGPDGDKRQWRRFNIELTILVEPVEESETESEKKPGRSRQATALVTDISMKGLFFIGAAVYDVGSVLDIQLTLGTQRYSLRGRVARTEDRQLPGRTAHGCGVEFVRSEETKAAIPAIANYILKKVRAGQAPQVVKDGEPARNPGGAEPGAAAPEPAANEPTMAQMREAAQEPAEQVAA